MFDEMPSDPRRSRAKRPLGGKGMGIMVRAAVGVLAVALFVGCGDGGEPASSGAVPERVAHKQAYTEQDIATALGISEIQPNVQGDPKTRCLVSAYLTTPANVALYADAGDPVASNPSRTAGVKYGTFQGDVDPGCHAIFTRRLRKLP